MSHEYVQGITSIINETAPEEQIVPPSPEMPALLYLRERIEYGFSLRSIVTIIPKTLHEHARVDESKGATELVRHQSLLSGLSVIMATHPKDRCPRTVHHDGTEGPVRPKYLPR